MRFRLRAIFYSVSLRLLLRLLVLFVLVFGVYAVISLRTNSAQWTRMINSNAEQTSELIRDATHYGMLLNEKDVLHHTIQQIAKTPGVSGIRIYDKHGMVMFSANKAEIGTKVDRQAEACVICHDKDKPLRRVPRSSRLRIFRAPNGERIAGLITPIQNEPGCARIGCHVPPSAQSILGVLDVKMSLKRIDQAQSTARANVILLTLLVILLTAVVTIASVHRVVTKPVRRLQEGTQRVARGDLETRIDVSSRDEMGRLAEAFNTMTEDLQRARAELTDWSQTLEQKVANKTDELGRMQRQVVHMEKMASLGKLSATVAHELNNPLAGILVYAKLVERDLGCAPLCAEEQEELHRYLKLIQKESSRCGEIVRNLLLFARQSAAAFAPAHLNDIVERCLLLMRHHLEMAEVTLDCQPLDGDDEVLCDGDQIQQALVALVVNAAEAMQHVENATLTIRLKDLDDSVQIRMTDNGYGIAPEVQPHIFEPFYSTKEKESGVGLGLAVVYGIVQRHGGVIDVNSEVGTGTTFIWTLRRRPPPESGLDPTLAESRDAPAGSKERQHR
ncbi:MAG: ATP-binding protein [bacterium]